MRLRIGILVVALALIGAACGDSGDDHECQPCKETSNCNGGQECVLGVDDNLRCFDIGDATCQLDKVNVARKPTPTPIATP